MTLVVEIACGVALGLFIFRYITEILGLVFVWMLTLWEFLAKKYSGIWGIALLLALVYLVVRLFPNLVT